MEMDFICWKAFSLSLPLITSIQPPSLMFFSPHLPFCVSMCDLSPDWISQASSSPPLLSFSSACPLSFFKPYYECVYSATSGSTWSLVIFSKCQFVSLNSHVKDYSMCCVYFSPPQCFRICLWILVRGAFFKCHTILFPSAAHIGW